MSVAADPLSPVAGREELEAREERWLAPYAMKSRRTKGRQHPEAEDPVRTAYRRDRDRIIHTTAFRRLEYKTQVFVNHEGDHYRTRLTHTLEVAQIGVSIARVLRLNEDLVEAVALAHAGVQRILPGVAERRVAEIVRQRDGFDQVLVQLQRAGDGTAKLCDF